MRRQRIKGTEGTTFVLIERLQSSFVVIMYQVFSPSEAEYSHALRTHPTIAIREKHGMD